jgi:hypothetical protein
MTPPAVEFRISDFGFRMCEEPVGAIPNPKSLPAAALWQAGAMRNPKWEPGFDPGGVLR